MCVMGALFGDDEVDAEVFDGGAVFWRDASVGDDDVDFLSVADFCEAAFAKLAGVGKHDGLLCGLHHLAVEVCLTHIGG